MGVRSYAQSGLTCLALLSTSVIMGKMAHTCHVNQTAWTVAMIAYSFGPRISFFTCTHILKQIKSAKAGPTCMLMRN